MKVIRDKDNKFSRKNNKHRIPIHDNRIYYRSSIYKSPSLIPNQQSSRITVTHSNTWSPAVPQIFVPGICIHWLWELLRSLFVFNLFVNIDPSWFVGSFVYQMLQCEASWWLQTLQTLRNVSSEKLRRESASFLKYFELLSFRTTPEKPNKYKWRYCFQEW